MFSFGVILYELFARYLTLCAVSIQGTPEELDMYAHRVSEGFRLPLIKDWPDSLKKVRWAAGWAAGWA